MPLPSTGKISFSQLQTEFGGSNPISFSEYYRDKANKFAYAVTASPLTGNVIRMSNFRGVSKAYPPATIEYHAGSQNYTSEHNGSNTFEINIYTNYYWTQTINMYVRYWLYEFDYSYTEHEFYDQGYGYGDSWEVYVYKWNYYNIHLSTSTIYANNYSGFNVSYNSNDGGYYVTLIHNLAPYGEPNRHQYIYWRRTGDFYVNISYSQPP